MKDFYEMTADEIRDYRGPVHWARTIHLCPDGVSYDYFDYESPSLELLQKKLMEAKRLTILSTGVREGKP